MRTTLFTAFIAIVALNASSADWPIVRHFDGDHLQRVALPLGGIGTGSIALGGRGEICEWEIMNVPNKGVNGIDCDGATRTFFAINLKGANHNSATALQGPMYPQEYYSGEGHPTPQGGLPRFNEVNFDAAFPFGVAHLSDKDLPVKVDVKGFSPFTPGDSDSSQLPVAFLEYVVENIGSEALEVSIAAFVKNIVGNNGKPVGWRGNSLAYSEGENDNVTEYREADGIKGLYCWSRGVDIASTSWGSFALVTDDAEAEVSYREASVPNEWNRTILEWWDDFTADGQLHNLSREGNIADGGLCLKKTIGAGEKKSFKFAIAWRFPNRFAWSAKNVGNWYAQFYEDGWDAAKKIVPRRDELEKKTLEFTSGIVALDVPNEIKEAALSNLAVLKSQTVFREAGGHFMGWEGVFDHDGSCAGSCTHVWNYENAVATLFPDLARTMRDVEFNYALHDDDGKMNFRAGLPLEDRGDCWIPFAAADGQLGCIMKVYRDWKICGDDEWLKAIWPRVKLALSYAWKEWDTDKDGLMEGGQHNTMDVFYFGPNPQMEFWYMGALRAATEMAIWLGENDFALECDDIFRKASTAVDEKLFNGDYYEHIIAAGHENDPYQLGPGCLVDQLVGQQMAHLWDLGDLAKKENLKKTCESIMKWNWLDDFSRHFNNMRIFAAGHESGLLMASWPKGRLEVPFPYFGEVMTGFEYVAAAEMIFQGMDAEAVKVIKAIRDRHDGAKRNPFSEPECGHHYARSMASWNCLLAWQKAHDQSIGYVFDHAHNYGLDDYVGNVVTIDDIRNAPPADALYRDPTADIEARVEDVMKYMTMEEKAAVIHAGGALHTTGIPRIGLGIYRFTDGASGIRAENCPGVTYFPVGIAWAAAWDEELAYLSGRAQGEEARGAYGHGHNYDGSCRMMLGPGGNLARTPLGARNFEYLGEDPVLVGKTAAAFCKGLQSVKVSPSMKHFCLNDQEFARTVIMVDCPDRALHEIYVRPFEIAAMEGDAWAFMNSYNGYRGEWTSHSWELNRILFEEGWKGALVSDWGGYRDDVAAINGGSSMETPAGISPERDRREIAQVESGEISRERFEDAVRRTLRLAFRVGAFDFNTPDDRAEQDRCEKVFRSDEHLALSYRAAAEGLVLLQNENNYLPLDETKIKKVVIAGPNADQYHSMIDGSDLKYRGGSGAVKAGREITPLMAAVERFGRENVIWAPTMRFENQDSDEAITVKGMKACKDPLAAAKDADLVIYCGGLDHSLDREVLGWGMIYPNDRPNLNFKTVDGAEMTQEEWIKALAAVNKNTIVSITAGAAVTTEPFKKSVPSILLTWYSGEFAGEILLDTVFGKINPSGRLPITIGRKLEDWPCHRMGENVYPGVVFDPVDWKGTQYMAKQSYDEGIWVGYRAFEHFEIEPEYPFGFGLSYTTFKVTKGKAKDDVYTAVVENTGDREGRCVVQCYVAKPEQFDAEMPVKELVRFASVNLAPGEKKAVSFTLNDEDFRYWSEKADGWKVAKGKSKIMIGLSSTELPVTYKVSKK